MIENKIIRLLYANYRAISNGFSFIRTKGFVVPHKIQRGNSSRIINAPINATKMFKEIFLYDEYFLRKLKNESINNIVDIGANIGIFSITARTFFPASTIYAFEPNSEVFPILQTNAKEFVFKCTCAAIGPKDCSGNTLKQGFSGCLSKFIPQQNGLEKMLNFAEISPLDDDAFIDILKIDCEGCEYELLKCKEPWNKIRFLTMEFHENKIDNISKILRSVNFEIVHSFSYPFYTGIVLARNKNLC